MTCDSLWNCLAAPLAFGFMQRGMLAALLIGIVCAVIGAFVVLLTALGIGVITRRTRVSQDTAIGVLFAGTFALGVALLSTVKNYTKDLFGLLLGDVLAIQPRDLIVIAVMGALMLLVVFALYKELVLLTYDPVQAEVIGLPVNLLRVLLLTSMFVLALILSPHPGSILWGRHSRPNALDTVRR